MKIYEIFEKIVIFTLTVLMGIVLFFAVIDLGWIVFSDIISPPIFLFDIKELLDIFGMFLLVLIGLELLATMRVYIRENTIRVRVVFTVALIAVARKVIILDPDKHDGIILLGIAAIILALAVGYFLIRKVQNGSEKIERPKKGD
ncbi:MAG: phosphate-starvation-inducible PsiE family protein [Deltaproteobacteria bacterium]|nr:phosphate-starvation-inducible PsiE family protein [Candidatus Zymogenaceae bacterium]